MKFTIEKPEHFSPSTLNSFIAYRDKWFISKILGERGPGNPAMYRGSSVEEGINYFVGHRKKEDWISNTIDENLVTKSVNKAVATFAMKCAESDDDPSYMTPSIGACTRFSIEYLTGIWDSETPILQKKISTTLDGVSIPVIGYLDYLLHNEIQDLKVSASSPVKSKITDSYELPQNYIIQGAIYKHAENLDVTFYYCVSLKGGPKMVPVPLTNRDYEWGIQYVTMAAQKLELIYDTLSKPFGFQTEDDIGEVFAAMAFPSMDAFWNKKEREHAAKIWSIPDRRTPVSPYSMPEKPNPMRRKLWKQK